ncbi:MAG: MBL fold metallo-hydrolase [Deltaproteobacteria bacterium]|nr:MBL fold metallo-hydrolase [Deltaproteobacteria bacterium]
MALRVIPVVESRFKLDGGAMFGVVPKTLWSRGAPADDENRVQLVCRVLVVVYDDGRLAVVDAGIGESWSGKDRAIYRLEPAGGLSTALARLGRSSGDVTDVILTHLHFDHAAGIVRPDGSLRFARATHHVQKANLAYARKPSAKDEASYRPETIEALEGARLRVLDGPGEVLPGIHARLSNGHTKGLQVISIDSTSGLIVFASDLIPTRAHVHLPWLMAYDNHPLKVIAEKDALFFHCAVEKATLVLAHDPEVAAVRVGFQGDRWLAMAVDLPA